jgi:hypothetical protein
MRIDIEQVKKLKAELDEINRHSLHVLEVYENGVKIESDKHLIEALEQTPLTNFNIILGNFYKQK